MLKNVIDRRKIMYILFSIFILYFCQLFINHTFEFIFNRKLVLTVIAIVLYFCVSYFTKINLARNAFLLVSIFGIVVALNKPVQYGLDEESHLENAIGLSDSILFKYSDEKLSDYEAVELHDGIRNQENFKDDNYWKNVKHSKSEVSGKPISFDNPAFLPGMIGWNLGKVFSDKIIISYYLGRIFHVLAYAFLVYFAIKSSRVFKKMIFLLGTFPSTLFVISGYHYDYLYYAASLFLVAILTNILSREVRIDRKQIIFYQLATLAFAFSKFPFCLLGCLLSIFPTSYYRNKNDRHYNTVLFIINFLIALTFAGFIPILGTDPAAVGGSRPSIIYFMIHPLPIIRTMISAPAIILENFIGNPINYTSIGFGSLSSILISVFLIFLFVISIQTKFQIPKYFRLILIILFLGITFLLIYAITGDPRVYSIGNLSVGGVQGRYYFLMILFVPILFGDFFRTKFNIKESSLEAEEKFTYILQLTVSFLIILTISIALYTQI